jgi:acyl carrier protein
LSDQDSLLETGVIDSLAMVDLIAHLEKTYGISIGEDDMVPENFDSIDSIASYVERRRGKPASGN